MDPISYRDISAALSDLGLRRETPVIAHISMPDIGTVRGGLNTVMGALLAAVDNVMMPTFTFSTMVVPTKGPPDNNLIYGQHHGPNLEADVFTYDLPSDMINSEAGEALRTYPGTYRSEHPIFSFAGLGLDAALVEHPPNDPYAPIRFMHELDGWVVLMGARAAENFSIHLAEKEAGRKQFTRWALTPEGIAEVPHFPGCPNGFHKLDYYLGDELHRSKVGEKEWSAVKLDTLLTTATTLMKEDVFALLCNDLDCARCNLVRAAIKAQYADNWQTEA